MNKNDKVWIMANDLRKHVCFLTNGEWYECTPYKLRDDFNGFKLVDDDGDVIFVNSSGSSHTESGVWNVHNGEFPPLPDHTQEIVEGLELVLNQRFDSYDA